MTEAMARANELIRRTKETLSPGRMVAETEVSWLLGEARFLAETVLSLPQRGVEAVVMGPLEGTMSQEIEWLFDDTFNEHGPSGYGRDTPAQKQIGVVLEALKKKVLQTVALTPKVIDRDIEGETIERAALERIADVSERWQDSLVSQINEIARTALAASPERPTLAAAKEALEACRDALKKALSDSVLVPAHSSALALADAVLGEPR